MGGVRCHELSAHKPFLHALPHHFLKQTAKHLPKRGLPTPQLADCAVVRHSFIQVNAKIPPKCVAVCAPLLNLPFRWDAVQKTYQQIFYDHHRVDGRPAVSSTV